MTAIVDWRQNRARAPQLARLPARLRDDSAAMIERHPFSHEGHRLHFEPHIRSLGSTCQQIGTWAMTRGMCCAEVMG